MSHMVIYRGADGKPGYHQTDDIHDAVMYVEGLRNDKEVDHARIFRLEEVTFEYKPYYRVELSVGGVPVTSGANGSSGAETLAAAESNEDDDDVMETTESAADDADDDVADDDADDDASDSYDSDDLEDESDHDDHDEDAVPAAGVRRGLFGR